jgi:hypothetical protein
MKEIDTLRAPECLDTVSTGLFAVGKLGDEEKQRKSISLPASTV